MASDKKLFKLIDKIAEVYDDPALKPKDGVTYCNIAVQHILNAFNYQKLNGLMANMMIERMRQYAEFVKIGMEKAQGYANMGYVVIAGKEGQPHGHVCIVRPGLEATSGKWKKNVPKCMNIGKDVSIGKGVNYAFQEIPEFWVLSV